MKAKFICPILLLLVIAGHLAANLVWDALNAGPDPWDQSEYLEISQRYLKGYKDGGLAGYWDAFVKSEKERQPLLPALWVPLYGLLGNSRATAHVTDHAALVVLCLSVYAIGRRLGGRWCGLAAAWITMMFPMMFGLSRQLYVEFCLTAAVAAVAYLCIASDGLRRWWVSLLLGVALGLGLLIKITLPLFVFGPLLVAFGVNIFSSRQKDPLLYAVRLVANLALIVAPAFLIAAPWLGYNLTRWLAFMMENVSGHRGSIYDTGVYNFLSSIAVMIFFSIHFIILVVLFVLWLIRRKRGSPVVQPSPDAKRERSIVLITVCSWLVIPLVVGMIARDKDTRLVAPMLPALGILLAYAYVKLAGVRFGDSPRRTHAGEARASDPSQVDIGTTRHRDIGTASDPLADAPLGGDSPLRALVLAALLVAMLVPFFGVSFGMPFDSSMPDRPMGFTIFNPKYFLGRWSMGVYACAPNRDDWKGEEVVSAIEDAVPKELAEAGRITAVTVVTNHPYFEARWFQYLHWRGYIEGTRKQKVSYSFLPYFEENATVETYGVQLLQSNLVLAKDSGWQGPDFTTKWFVPLTRAMDESKSLFERIDTGIILPDGSQVVIFRNKTLGRRLTEEEKEEYQQLQKEFMELLIKIAAGRS